MVSTGMPSFLPVLTAAVVYTGSMEFLLTGILISSFNPAAAFITAIAVGSRHLFYGLSMALGTALYMFLVQAVFV